MICKINTGSDHFRAFRYVLQEHKRATILETNIKGEGLNRAIIDREIITNKNSKLILQELTYPFSQVKKILPHIKNSMVHIKICFDPQDGEVSRTTKIAVADGLLDCLGYDTTAKVVVNHHRDDPDHSHVHDHDHTHVIASAINYSFIHVRDSHNFSRAKEGSRAMEKKYKLTPFVAKAEREQTFEDARAQVDASPIIKPTFEAIISHEHEYEHQEPAQERMGR
jgi:hypothetical protein